MKKSVYLSSLLAFCLSLFAAKANAQAPVVTTDPANSTICAHDTTYFHVVATGATPLSFMWQYSDDAGTSWDTVVNGASYFWATNDTLAVIPSVAKNGYLYRAIVSNGSGMDTSASATLTVDTAFAGVISGMVPVCVGSSITLTSSVAGGSWSNVNHAIDTVSPLGVLEGRAFGVDTIKYSVTNTCGLSTSTANSRVDTLVTFSVTTGPTHVCVGNVITLVNNNTIGTTTWSTAVGNVMVAASGATTGVSAGSDVVTHTFSNACGSIVSTKSVFVEVLPSTGTITGATALCSGSWIHLTSSVGGGVWLSGSPAVAPIDAAGFVTGTAQGTSVISYYRSNSCGAAYATHTITVEVPAAAIGGNDSVGIDSFLVLSNTTPGGAWASADTMIAKFTTGSTIKGIDTGVTTVTYTVSNTCGTTSATSPMHVGPLPNAGVITGPDTVCVGSTISLDASVAGGTWVSLHDTLATIVLFNDTTGRVTGVELGKDTVVYYVTTAFGRSSIKKPVYVNDRPDVTITGPASVALSGSYSLVGSPAGGAWSTSNMAMTPLIGYGFFVVIDTGTSVFTYVATNTCGSTTKTFTVELHGSSSGVNGVAAEGSSLNVFPNPSQGTLTVNISGVANEQAKVVITNIAGQTVKEFTAVNNTNVNVSLNEPAGVYLLTAIAADGSRHTARITIAD
ncbi:MAG: T9SS type A sorting domain-containing protein [Flavipsychrobacter sp.]|nr:T9SS type A sorting domain-containing protein [Flavipsychrobacter sp.]